MGSTIRLSLMLLVLGLSGCDLLGIETLSQVQARRTDEGKAIGSGCRQAGRAIEDCYAMNGKSDKAAVFAGWREMNDYMTENKLDVVLPLLAQPTARAGDAADEAEDEARPAKRKSDPGG